MGFSNSPTGRRNTNELDALPADFVLTAPASILDTPIEPIFTRQAELMRGRLAAEDLPLLTQWARQEWLALEAQRDLETNGLFVTQGNKRKLNESYNLMHRSGVQTLAIAQQLGMTRKTRKVTGLSVKESERDTGEGQFQADLDAIA